MPRKRLLYDARGITPKPCGVRNVAENYLRELASYYDVIALANAQTAHLIDVGIAREIAPPQCSRLGLLSDAWVSWQVLKHKPNIFLSAHSFLPPLAILPSIKAFICHDLFAVLDKSFFAKHGFLAPLARLFFRVLVEISFFRASVVIAPSAAVAKTFKNLITQPRKVVVIHNGIFLRPPLPGERQNHVLYVGNFRSYKGFDVLYKAWRLLLHDPASKGWILDAVTNETPTSIERFVAEHGPLPHLKFHSRIADRALDALRSRARIAVVPSRQEGFGIPLLEAVAAGGTILYSDIPVFRELIQKLDIESCVSFPSGEAQALADAIISAMSNCTGEAAIPGEDRLKQIQAEYSWSNSAATLAAQLE